MGIRPNGQALPTVAYDTPSQQFGQVLTALDDAGSTAGGALADIASTADSANTAVQVIADGQLALQQQTELLDGARGYCCAYQSKNIDSGKQEGVFSHGLPGYRLLPFNRQLGPAKGAHPHPDGGIVFDEPGLWTVYVYAFLGDARNLLDAAIGTSLWVRMTVWDRDTELSGASKFDSLEWTESDKAGVFNVATFSVPVVVPSAGYMVTVEGKGTHNRWWRGGTRYSRLAVVKHDNRVDNLPQETVPNEPV